MAIRVISPSPRAEESSGLDMTMPVTADHSGSHHRGPCSPARATTADRAAFGVHPAIWSPWVDGARSESRRTKRAPSSAMAL